MAGAFGGFMRAFHPRPQSWWQFLLLLVSGGVMAFLFAEMAAHWFSWTGISVYAAGFVVGVMGYGVLGALVRASDKLEINATIKKKD